MIIIQGILCFILVMGFVFGIIGLMFYQPKPKGYMAEMDCKAHNEKLLRELEELEMNYNYKECKNCERRKPLCHSTCPDYTKFREENLKRYEKNKEKANIRYAHRERMK